MACWLFKSEPASFGIDDLAVADRQTTSWDGVRNYQARNFLRDQVQIDDQVLFYHSGIATPGIVGIATVIRAGYPDPTAFDPASDYYDPKSRQDQPRWFAVDIRMDRKLDRTITLTELKQQSDLQGFQLIARGNRLSVLPVTPEQWTAILKLE